MMTSLGRPLVVVALCAAALGGAVPGPSARAAAPTPGAATGPPVRSHTAAQVAAARRMLATIRVGGRGPRTGYQRIKFGAAWLDVDRNRCRTRDDILARDLTDVIRRDRCVVIAGTLADPYTGQTLHFRKTNATAVQLDHVTPLALAWQLGAAQWPAGRRIAFANDPANLLAVDGHANAAKQASGPDSWLPPNKPYRCTYAIRFTRVVAGYHLRLTPSMRASVTLLLDKCLGVAGSPAGLPVFGTKVWRDAARFAAQFQPRRLAG